jgi:hypothetical protein
MAAAADAPAPTAVDVSRFARATQDEKVEMIFKHFDADGDGCARLPGRPPATWRLRTRLSARPGRAAS